MKSNLFIVICILASLGIISCQKEVSFELPDNTTSNVVSSLDSNYLDRILIVENNLVDSNLFVFNYDGQKRINNVSIKSTSNPLDSGFYIKFFYNLNDTLPFKAKTFLDSVDYYFYYDGLGRLKKDSILRYDSQAGQNPSLITTLLVTNYSYALNKIFLNSYFIAPNSGFPNPQYGLDTFFQDLRGNIIMEKLYSNNSTLQNTIASTFDNKINPFTKVNGFKIFIFSNGDFPGGTCQNNLLSFNKYDNTQPGNIYTENYFNTYYTNGFLKKAVVTGNSSENWTYFYKSL